ncbi:hypothetical protein M9H77_16525 [Catharanthus roseus]|uniref:Uncharacterized protein n=1 Tax=Catharanthus roseus TaxID=4058 RepID=A0ACC0B1Z2_CATRO|nr:hypothetical protein M9H77_16525 [Catharanthus roseus]
MRYRRREGGLLSWVFDTFKQFQLLKKKFLFLGSFQHQETIYVHHSLLTCVFEHHFNSQQLQFFFFNSNSNPNTNKNSAIQSKGFKQKLQNLLLLNFPSPAINSAFFFTEVEALARQWSFLLKTSSLFFSLAAEVLASDLISLFISIDTNR